MNDFEWIDLYLIIRNEKIVGIYEDFECSDFYRDYTILVLEELENNLSLENLLIEYREPLIEIMKYYDVNNICNDFCFKNIGLEEGLDQYLEIFNSMSKSKITYKKVLVSEIELDVAIESFFDCGIESTLKKFENDIIYK